MQQAACHVVHLGCLVENLVSADHVEVHVHQFDDRAQAGHRCADGHSYEALLADRRIDDAAFAELFHHVARHAEEAAIVADIFPDQEDAFIAAHLIAHGLVDCLNIGCLSHKFSRPVRPCRRHTL